ncbi:Defense protein l(2)34Fc [Holothuria leucospilota]|uniref:Defense protein l(2)34Fc n=1 Tax=Holothuria leucospilota TaxID=206669 RepID=A0A9Q1BLB2_HOLLE|nr:Defense protein l(2)34Fc [Holothuria leucospilota]
MALLRVFLLGVCSVGVCYGYGSGAPRSACESMTPGHLTNGTGSEPLSPQTGSAPFGVTVNVDKFGLEDEVEVTIGGDTQNFVGFFIQARVDGEEEAVGSFSGLNEEKMKYVDCSDTYANEAVTHTNQFPTATPFESVQLNWTSPKTKIGNIKFYATVAQNHDIYWVKLESEPLTYNGFTVLSPTLSLLLLPVAVIFTRYL